jgi:alpha-L-fucosidase 2
LRTVGAFLVSAQIKAGEITGVKITSEKGGTCTLANPWPKKRITVLRNGKTSERLEGENITFQTKIGETITIKP